MNWALIEKVCTVSLLTILFVQISQLQTKQDFLLFLFVFSLIFCGVEIFRNLLIRFINRRGN